MWGMTAIDRRNTPDCRVLPYRGFMLKKLQENSLYWRYRFITRRWLAIKRTVRSWQKPSYGASAAMRGPMRPRGAAVTAPRYLRDYRGPIFVGTLALTLTMVQLVLASVMPGSLYGLVVVALIALSIYGFTRVT